MGFEYGSTLASLAGKAREIFEACTEALTTGSDIAATRAVGQKVYLLPYGRYRDTTALLVLFVTYCMYTEQSVSCFLKLILSVALISAVSSTKQRLPSVRLYPGPL